ncbi:hypothetical protein P175DRAFT_0446413 [Aspergillus ochraceoroseus IBT 24754]|uniref:Glucose-methanol-choline oxidoreductase N-terminal domain-containing protein n=1 Tax=Aspergillus ochraceoroseus IBT 24754 TaxID=1392256 RepID=A0A2T5LLM8_9EURO|nr:uncharacterized protein P175DRAFT_0446413 [Aspergillus ochraceoroseus IBT 24754]PTU17190.1 hypothetical protein P175DRAFT_0446413 [Aspergillus ochraceoroseus IBT 24754]
MVTCSKISVVLGLLACNYWVAGKTFDYIIVGGGTAGITIAARLAEQSQKVALIEAGERYEATWPLAAIPGADVLPVGSDPKSSWGADWGFVTTPQPGANGREVHFARGKCLGGSSAFNFMVYQRPTKQSMKMWADVVNDQSYSFDSVLPFYQRSVDFTAPNSSARIANASVKYNPEVFNNTGGPLQVSYSNFAMPFSTWMKVGMESIGVPEASDFNSGELNGYHSETSFLATKNTNLQVYSKTLAKRVLFDGQNNAVGVEVSDGWGFKTNITASKEVVVSAGTFHSPQLLMVSGIGPTDQLEAHGINVVSNLPGVGQNLWDHPFFGPSYRVNVETFTRLANDLLYTFSQFLGYSTVRDGPLANPVADFLAWEKIPSDLRSEFSSRTQHSLAQFPDDWPEAEYISGAGYIGNFSNLLTNQPKDGSQYASMLGVLITPISRGNITLASPDTSDLPIVNPNWLVTEADQQVSIAMFKRMRQAFTSSAMAPVVIGEEYYPGSDIQTDEEILEFIRNNIMTLWHPACTCKMGTSNDSMAVIDNRARVFGVNRLRVVDASSFPFLPPGHPQSSVYMLAEKIAEDILLSS